MKLQGKWVASTHPPPDDRSCVALNAEPGRGGVSRRREEIRDTKRGGGDVAGGGAGAVPGGAGPKVVLPSPYVPGLSAAPDPEWAVGSGERKVLTHVLRVQLHGRHLFQRNVPRSAVSAAPQAAEYRGGHHAGTTDSSAASRS